MRWLWLFLLMLQGFSALGKIRVFLPLYQGKKEVRFIQYEWSHFTGDQTVDVNFFPLASELVLNHQETIRRVYSQSLGIEENEFQELMAEEQKLDPLTLAYIQILDPLTGKILGAARIISARGEIPFNHPDTNMCNIRIDPNRPLLAIEMKEGYEKVAKTILEKYPRRVELGRFIASDKLSSQSKLNAALDIQRISFYLTAFHGKEVRLNRELYYFLSTLWGEKKGNYKLYTSFGYPDLKTNKNFREAYPLPKDHNLLMLTAREADQLLAGPIPFIRYGFVHPDRFSPEAANEMLKKLADAHVDHPQKEWVWNLFGERLYLEVALRFEARQFRAAWEHLARLQFFYPHEREVLELELWLGILRHFDLYQGTGDWKKALLFLDDFEKKYGKDLPQLIHRNNSQEGDPIKYLRALIGLLAGEEVQGYQHYQYFMNHYYDANEARRAPHLFYSRAILERAIADLKDYPFKPNLLMSDYFLYPPFGLTPIFHEQVESSFPSEVNKRCRELLLRWEEKRKAATSTAL